MLNALTKSGINMCVCACANVVLSWTGDDHGRKVGSVLGTTNFWNFPNDIVTTSNIEFVCFVRLDYDADACLKEGNSIPAFLLSLCQSPINQTNRTSSY